MSSHRAVVGKPRRVVEVADLLSASDSDLHRIPDLREAGEKEMLLRVCLRCGGDLVRNPRFTHWAHCPKCDSAWADWSAEENYRIKAQPELKLVGISRLHK